MNNDHGFSFPETILTVSILFLLFGTFLPMANQMKMSLADRKVSLHVAIAKSQAATSVQNGHLAGNVMIDGINYAWEYSRPTLCVRYTLMEVGHESCDTF